MNKPAAIYARVSSDRQKENHTIASQTAALIEYAQKNGYSVPHFQVVLGGQWTDNAGSYGLAIGAVPSKRIPEAVDRIFEVMYLAGKLDTPGMGFMFITPLEKAGTFIPQELLQNLEKSRAKREKGAEP